MSKLIELMAPAGSFESLQAAIDAGADSIYFGVEQLNMRAVASINFTIDDLPEIVSRCQPKGIRTYLTLNTILYDHDIQIMRRLIDAAVEAGVSAIIAADHAAISYARSKQLEVHISTQLNITNVDTIRFYAAFADTMVLSRELTLTQVKKITQAIAKENICGPSGKPVEIEIFGHGALCMAVSGKCYLSLHTHQSSANRGACRQNCRKAYQVKDEDGNELLIDNEYIMSPKDLCTLPFLQDVLEAGVKVLKIEGRGRSADYVYTTVKCYSEAINSIAEGSFSSQKVKDWLSQLDKVYNRGFWAGYYLGQKMGEWTTDHPGNHASEKKILVGKAEHYYPKIGIAQFLIESFDIQAGDKLLITGPTTGVQYAQAEQMVVDNLPVETATKGNQVTLPLSFKVRPSDKLYKIVRS